MHQLSTIMALQNCLLPSLSSSPSKSFVSPLPFRRSYINISVNHRLTKLHISSATPNPTPTTPETETNFDWFSHWYPLDNLCDLDKQAPKARTALGLDVVIWWDRVDSAWKVFDDRCPHRLAPLSEGRIDHQGRLQCVYHGWCFDGAGACKYIPQAPTLGPPVHKNEKACVAVYPSIVQNNILWFWPNTSSQYKDIMNKTKPPYIPELDDLSFFCVRSTRDFLYGYEILTENLLDPAHLPYAHYGLLDLKKNEDPGRYISLILNINCIYMIDILNVETDREGGTPLKLTIEKSDISGFDAEHYKFIAPYVVYFTVFRNFSENSGKAGWNPQKLMSIFFCVPVNPGKSRVLIITTWNFATLIDKFIPRWYYHRALNLVLDADLYLLHVEERKLVSDGISNWHKVCYVPTQSDTMVVAFRSWLRKYSNNQVNWRTKSFAALPTSPPREQLMDRYWSHVVHCKSCRRALRTMKAIKVSLQVVSIGLIGILAAANHSIISNIAKTGIVAMAITFFAASHWLSQFIHKTFYYHDYNHAIFRTTNTYMEKILGALRSLRLTF